MPRSTNAAACLLLIAAPVAAQEFRILVLTTTTGFHHKSIPAAVAALHALGGQHCFAVESTDDPAAINTSNLARFDAVVFLLTTGDILNAAQQAAFESWFAGGRGWVGVHSAADTEPGWPFYTQLIGAHFVNHPLPQTASIIVSDPNHPSTAGLPDPWVRFDEWYNFNHVPQAHILLRLDESTYTGGQMGPDHPIAWCKEVLGGRAWYTALGHFSDAYSEPLFRRHLFGGISWAAGNPGCECYPDCNASGSLTVADFGCFQNWMITGHPYADCNHDAAFNVQDFGCFQTRFVQGCP